MPEITTAAVEASIDVDNDYLPGVDVSEGAVNKFTPANLLGNNLKQIRALTNPGADKVVGWDDSAGVIAWMDPDGSGAIPETEITTAGELNDLITTATANPANIYDYVVTTGFSIAGAVTVPKNMFGRFVNGAKITDGGGGTLTFQGPGIAGDPHFQIFASFAAGEVKWTGEYPPVFRAFWWGAVPGVDDAPTRTANSLAFDSVFAGMLKMFGGIPAGGVIETGSEPYYMAETLEIRRPITWRTPANVGGLIFPANTSGIIGHGYSTVDGAFDLANGSIQFAEFTGLRLVGTIGATEQTVTVNGLVVTKTAGLSFDHGRALDGETITIDTVHYPIDLNAGNNATTLNLKKPKFTGQVVNANTDIYNMGYETWSTWWAGASISYLVPGGESWVSLGTVTSVDPAEAFGVSPGSMQISGTLPADGIYEFRFDSFANTTGLAARLNAYHGIDVRQSHVKMDIYIHGFAGSGVNLDSTSTPTYNSGTEPNCNMTQVNAAVTNCTGSGVRARGINSNQCNIVVRDATNNGGYGIYDNSFLGNNYTAVHTSFNDRGHIFSDPTNGVNLSTFVMPYTEGGSPSAEFGDKNVVVGGNLSIDKSTARPKIVGVTGEDDYAVAQGGTITGGLKHTIATITSVGNGSVLDGTAQLIRGNGTSVSPASRNMPNAANFAGMALEFYNASTFTDSLILLGTFEDGSSSTVLQPGHYRKYISDGTMWVEARHPTRVLDRGTRPAASVAYRGHVWLEEGGAGVADVVSVCLKSAADSYSWVTVSTG